MEKIDRRILPDENSQSISLPFDISSTSNADGSNNNRVQVNSSPISPDATHSGKYNWDFAFDGITITSILPNQVSTAEYFWSEAEGSDLGDGITLGHTVDGGFFYSTYAHFQAGSVTVSDSNPFDNNYQTVEGEALGVSGDTGFGSGPHLHLQITPLFDNREELRANNPLVIGGSFGASVASPVKFDTALGVVLDGVVSIQNIDLSTDTSALRTPGGKIVDANIFLISDDAIDATGNDDENILSGNSGNNVIAGLGGADAIWGGQARDIGIDYRDYTKVDCLPSDIPVTAIAGVWGDNVNIRCLFEDADGNRYLRYIRRWGDAGYLIKELDLDAKDVDVGQMFNL